MVNSMRNELERPTVKQRTLRDMELLELLADCRRGHAELLASPERWHALPVVGIYAGQVDGCPVETRVCGCGEYVSKEIEG